jgi:hypothetical protein
LGNALLGEGDTDSARQMEEKLGRYADEDPRVRELLDKIRSAEAPPSDRPSGPGSAVPALGRRPRAGFSIQDELSMAWALHEAKELSADDYSRVVHDLTELSSQDSLSTISVLHTLEFRAAKNLDRVMHYVSRQCGTPLVALNSFGFPVESMTLLPIEFMVRRGVLCFGFIGSEALVALVNPYNNALRQEVAEMAGRPCHFFPTLPSEFDAAIVRIRSQIEDKTSKV